MTLQKSKQLSHGLSGNYWKITKVSADKLALRLDVTISLFRSKEQSDGDLTALGYSLIKSIAAEQPEPLSMSRPFNKKNGIIQDLGGSEDV